VELIVNSLGRVVAFIHNYREKTKLILNFAFGTIMKIMARFMRCSLVPNLLRIYENIQHYQNFNEILGKMPGLTK